jgi:hypothetical protein
LTVCGKTVVKAEKCGAPSGRSLPAISPPSPILVLAAVLAGIGGAWLTQAEAPWPHVAMVHVMSRHLFLR